MAEWVRVNYRGDKKVHVEKAKLGSTNSTLFLGEPGTFWFNLGEPIDYKPKRLRRRVEGTSRRRPFVIDEFEPNGAE